MDNYIVTCTSSEASDLTVEVDANIFTAKSGELLTSGIEYACSIVASNDAGDGQPSAVKTFKTGWVLVTGNCFLTHQLIFSNAVLS